jgi:hypothetical protein
MMNKAEATYVIVGIVGIVKLVKTESSRKETIMRCYKLFLKAITIYCSS